MIHLKYKDIDLTAYNNFLNECLKKDYLDQGLHRHHILPKFMGGMNDENNLIILSYEDHKKAHLILADCFNVNSNEYKGNIFSVILLNKFVEGSKLNINMDGLYNPFKNKTHSDETKQRMRESHKKSFQNGRKGSRLGHKRSIESIQKSIETRRRNCKDGIIITWITGKKHTSASKRKMSIAKKLAVRSKSSRRIRIQHVELKLIFECILDAADYFKMSRKQIDNRIKKGVFIKLNNA